MQAAQFITDLIAGDPKPFQTEKGFFYSITLSKNYRIILSPNHIKTPMIDSVMIDWSKIKNIKVINIEEIND